MASTDHQTDENEILRYDISEALRHLMVSTDPRVVFSSLAKLCVPIFSDGCRVEITGAESDDFRIIFPRPGTAAPNRSGPPISVYAAINPRQAIGHQPYSGVVTYTWQGRSPSTVTVATARILVDLAASIVHQQRLYELVGGDRATGGAFTFLSAINTHIRRRLEDAALQT